MKKILFVVCTHGNEVAGLNLFLNHPYGQVDEVQWETIIGNPEALLLNQRFIESDLNRSFDKKDIRSYEEKRAAILKKRFSQYDVVYDVHTTQEIKIEKLDDCIFVNNNNEETLKECRFIQAPHIIWDSDKKDQKKYLTAHHPIGITLEYQKTYDYFQDANRIRNDFYNIIYQTTPQSSLTKILYEASGPVTQEERKKYDLKLIDFHPLSASDKNKLKLDAHADYVPVFVNNTDTDPSVYCFLNKKLQQIPAES